MQNTGDAYQSLIELISDDDEPHPGPPVSHVSISYRVNF